MKLYLVTEESIPIGKLLSIVEESIRGGVTAVQLREKNSSASVFLEKALALKEVTKQYDVPLIINDRVDIALAAGADGVHIGQDDLPLTKVREIIPSAMLVGVSCHNIEEAQIAEQNGANYIGVGAVFPTGTKKDANLLPPGELERIIASVSIPVVAIGGIKLGNMKEIIHHDIAGVAIVSEIMRATNPYQIARSMREILD